MFHCENDLLANLIVLTPKVARKKFRESIFQEWHLITSSLNTKAAIQLETT